jgi:hypothetical protein
MVFNDIKSLLITVVVGVVLIIFAISNFYTEFQYDSSQALITNITRGDSTNLTYNVLVSYNVNGINYSNNVVTDSSFTNKVDDNITIDYLKNDPNKIMLHTDRNKTALYSSVGGVACLFLFYYSLIQIRNNFQTLKSYIQ